MRFMSIKNRDRSYPAVAPQPVSPHFLPGAPPDENTRDDLPFKANTLTQNGMPRGAEPKHELSEREKLQLKQRGDNLRRRQGIGSAKYAEFFFCHRHAYPFTRKTYPALGGRVESSKKEWDGIDPATGRLAEWLSGEEATTTMTRSREREERRSGDDQATVGSDLQRDCRKRKAGDSFEVQEKEERRSYKKVEYECERSESSGGSAQGGYRVLGLDPENRKRDLNRDLKMLMDALRQIPTPRRAALAIEGMLSRREVQYALEKFGTGSELGLTRKELAAIAVLQNAVSYQ